MENPFQIILEKLTNIEHLLLELKHTPKTTESQLEAEQLLTIRQAGEFLNLSVQTLYDKVSKAEIPVCKKGKRLYFSKQELLDWLKSGRKKTFEEIAIEAELYISGKRKGKL